jgi:hypothetical protein
VAIGIGFALDDRPTRYRPDGPNALAASQLVSEHPNFGGKPHLADTMMLAADEFLRRFLLHILPTSLNRIRHHGLIANAGRRDNLADHGNC